MKICFLSDASNIHTLRWIKYFVDKGYEVHLISIEKHNPNISKNVKVHFLKRFWPKIKIISFPLNLLSDFVKINQLIKKIKPDIVHSHYITKYGIIGILARFHPFVVTTWGSDLLVDTKKSKIIQFLVKTVLTYADLITGDGENLIETLYKFNLKNKNIKLILHGVDTQKFKEREKSVNLLETLMIFNSPSVISVRNFEPVYNVETLIRSIPLILKKIPDAKIILVGDGTQKKYLMNLALSLNIMDSVRFVGILSHENLPTYLSSCDVYVSTSLSDSIAVSTLEAMACGLSPIVTDIGDNKKWIKDGENGFIVPIKDPESLAKSIIYLLKNEKIRKRFGKINRKIIEEKSDYNKEMRKMEELYRKLIRESRK